MKFVIFTGWLRFFLFNSFLRQLIIGVWSYIFGEKKKSYIKSLFVVIFIR